MKYLIALLFVFSSTSTMAAEKASKVAVKTQKSYTCTYTSSELGKDIVGKGKSQSAAFENAADKCYDGFRAAYKAMDGMDIIDLCANISCS